MRGSLKGLRPLMLAGITALGLSTSAPAGAQALIADLTEHLIAISTGFTGTSVVLFGTTEGKGDVVVTVQGPPQDTVVRRKEPAGGIWLNRGEVTFNDVPSYYAVASSAPLDQLMSERSLARNGLGIDNLRFAIPPSENKLSREEIANFHDALVRKRQELGLYPERGGTVRFVGDRLFRTTIYFPANVPTGLYQVQVYLISDGEIVNAETTPLSVGKTGMGAEISEFAHYHALIYATLAVIGSVIAGWVATLPFRKV